MPVEDHVVHARTVDTGRPWGCHNHPPYAEQYLAPDGYEYYTSIDDGSIVAEVKVTSVPHAMSTECRYDVSLRDDKCAGCMHRGVGEAYWVEYAKRLALEAGTPTAQPALPTGTPPPHSTAAVLPEPALLKPLGPANASASGAAYDPARLWRDH